MSTKIETATFAGGCFWCLEPPFDAIDGVLETTVGYTGGVIENPTYDQVCSGRSGHREAIAIAFDPAKVSYEKLVRTFFENIDPFDEDGQFADKGPQYTTAIYAADDAQRQVAEAVKEELSTNFGKPIATEIEAPSPFYAAEDYHQEYYEKNPLRYNLYKHGSGRMDKLCRIWGTAG